MLKFIVQMMYAVSPALVYGIIRNRMDHVIPLNQLLGIDIVSVGDGCAEAKVALQPQLKNHIGSAHASVVFGVAEAASGAAMAGRRRWRPSVPSRRKRRSNS